MTLFRQNLFTIVPLFLVFGIVYAYVSYELQFNEFRWSLDQEAAALGHTTYDFINHEPERYFIIGDDGRTAVSPQLETTINRILKPGNMLEAQITGSNSGKIKSTSPDFFSRYLIPENSAFQELHSSYRFSLDLDSEPALLHIITLIRFNDEVIEIHYVRNASAYAEIYSDIWSRLWYDIFIFIFAGFLVAMLVRSIIRFQLKKQYRLFRSYIHENRKQSLSESLIREFNELGSTLDVLVNVLDKNINWYKKDIIENEQARTSKQAALIFRQESGAALTKQNLDFGKTSISYQLTGDNPCAYFAQAIRKDDQLWFLAGKSLSKDAVETALHAEAILTIATRLASDIKDHLGLIAKLEELQQKVHIPFRFDLYVFDKEKGLIHNRTENKGKQPSGFVTIPNSNGEQPKVRGILHSYGNDMAKQLHSYLVLTKTLKVTEVTDDLVLLLNSDDEGFVIIYDEPAGEFVYG
ncbi:MAG: hypothetical protein LAT67_00410 [Balneolales bacterium]|nr:hypothetical protein [Balneolales bacterium]